MAAAMWSPCAVALLLILVNAAMTSAGTGRVVNFTINNSYVSGSAGRVQLDAQSKMFVNCTAVNLTDSSVVRIRKIDLKNPQTSVTISRNDAVDEDLNDPRFGVFKEIVGRTSDVKSYVFEVTDLAETDSANYICDVGRNSSNMSVQVNVSAVPRFFCNKTLTADRKSGKLSIVCPLFAYKLQSIAAYWKYSQREQTIIRATAGQNESRTVETYDNVNYTLRLLPAKPENGEPHQIHLEISSIERVPELFKTSYYFKAKGERGEVEQEFVIRDPAPSGPVHGVATNHQAWSYAERFLVTVLLTVAFGRLL